MSQQAYKNEHAIASNNAFADLKAKHKKTWEDGDYASFATYMETGAVVMLNQWPIAAGQSLLDVGCGSGQTAIPAAKKGIKVTGIDIAANLIAYARVRACEHGLSTRFDEGDAENLPYENASFDVVISVIGAMFAPDPGRVVSEVARVLKPGGAFYMANWTANSMPAQMFRCVSQITPPAAGIPAPVLWGDEETVIQRLENDFVDIQLTRKIYPKWNYPFPVSGVVDLFRTCFGPVKRAFDALPASEHHKLHRQLEVIYQQNGEYSNGVFTVTNGEYLEVVATRKE